MAEIFRATTEGPGGFEMEVCIKRILPHCSEDPAFVRMFIDEARVVARLRHANIVQIIDFNQVDGSYYIAMELVEGKDLKSLLRQSDQCGERLGFALAAAIAADVCRGLGYAHGRRYQGQPMNIVHRDISPHNVLLSCAGEVKITDFGIAKAASRSSKTSTGLVKGKLAYMAPEQAANEAIDQRVDQFATGLVLFEMIAGRRAYASNSDLEVLQQAISGAVPPIQDLRGDVPPTLAGVIRRATALSPADRYPDMAAMETDLRRFLLEISARPEDVDVGAVVRRWFGTSRSERPRTELLPAVADLPPFDDEPTSDGGSSVWRDTGGGDSSSITEARTTAQVALERAPTDPVDVARPAVALAPAAHRAAPVRPWLLAGGGAIALLLGFWSLWPRPVATGAVDQPATAALALAVDAGPTLLDAAPTTAQVDATPAAALAATDPDAGPPAAGELAVDRAPPREPRTGRVKLLVTDSWAEVFFGKRRLGETPLDVELPVGRRRLRLYNSYTRIEKWIAVEVKPGEVTQIATTLQPAVHSTRAPAGGRLSP
ncbi:MAG: serine/threonine protein kinase [Deltaproteobacteria bacterium]|nr:serine/threonine protein kinase [Deltaproteobacteria bacterium]